MHRLLLRQLKKCRGTSDVPGDWPAFVQMVNEAYHQSDADRLLIERSMELSSQELIERNCELTQRAAELSAVRETALECVISMAADGTITEFNRAAEQTFGYRREQVIGRPLAEMLIPPRLRAAHVDGIARFLQSGSARVVGRRVEITAMRADETEFPAEMAVTVVRIGSRPSFTAYLRDITERKQYEETLERERDFTTAILETITSLVAVIDVEGRLVGFNRACEHLTGYRFAEVQGKPVWQTLIPPEDHAAVLQALGNFRSGRFPAQFENHWLTRGGSRRLIAWSNTCIMGPDGAVQFLIGTGTDITERKLAEQLEHDRAQVLEMVAQNRPLGETLAHLARLVERQRPGMKASVLLLRDGRLWSGASPSLPADYTAAIDGIAIGPEVGSCGTAAYSGQTVISEDVEVDARWSEFRAMAREHGLRACWSVPVLGGDGRVLGTFAVYFPDPRRPEEYDLQVLSASARLAALAIEHQKLADQLAHQARHDPLTGLPNRALLEDRLDQALLTAERGGTQVGVFFIDLDGFKFINDTLGHHCGDLLLKQMSERLKEITRQADTLARMGGDEFTLISPQLDSREQATSVARRLLGAFRAPFQIEGRELRVGASIGIAMYPQDGTDCATLQRNADTAMYRAKSLGRSKFEFFNVHMNAAALERLELENQLRNAIDNDGELQLYYQPQVDREGRMFGVEALLRWNHPKLGLISPARFIPLAEESGLIIPIGAWVMREALRQARRWHEMFARVAPDLRISINVSPMQFAQSDFLPILANALLLSGVEPRLVELELTESSLMLNPECTAEKIARARELGVGVAIDDFGTGYSSLAYLHCLPIDTLKIDRSFVSEIGSLGSRATTGSRIAVIRAITSMARSLNLRTVAEGVETDLQYRFLRRIGCHAMQGFLFSPAVPACQIPQVLDQLTGGKPGAQRQRRSA